MSKIYEMHVEKSDVNVKEKSCHVEKNLTDSRPDLPSKRDPYPIIHHPNTIPPTEFMALGLYAHS